MHEAYLVHLRFFVCVFFFVLFFFFFSISETSERNHNLASLSVSVCVYVRHRIQMTGDKMAFVGKCAF